MRDSARGPLLGAGRSADVYAVGTDRVLRRYRDRDVDPREVLAMATAARAGFPVPRVYSVRGPDLILARVDGPTMLDELSRADAPRVRALAQQLAALHQQLHRVPAPIDFPTPFGEGPALLHLDLHPQNVLLSSSGPMVIDWANAARGPASADVAVSAAIFESAEVPPEHEARRALLLATFLAEFDASEVAGFAQQAARYWLGQAHLTAGERATLAARLQ